MRLHKFSLISAVLVWGSSAIAEESLQQPPRNTDVTLTFASARSVFVENSESDTLVIGGSHEGQECISNCEVCCLDGKLFGGIELLIIRPHFSNAFAFARGSRTPGSIVMTGQDFEFDYQGSFRLFAGYRYGNNSEYRFTYWHFRGDSWINGTAPGNNDFITDPFGNIVTEVTVIDPDSRRFGQNILGGDLIGTKAIVETNVYDLEYMKRVFSESSVYELYISGGLRIVDIDLSYESHHSLADGTFTGGADSSVDFIGVGPRVGVEFRRFFGDHRQTSFFIKTNGSLLLGNTDVTTSQTSPMFLDSQSESLTRTIPVFETELGVSRQYRDSLTFTVGWLFQAWFDMEFLNGNFGGFFDGANNSNILSFDGLFLRGEFAY